VLSGAVGNVVTLLIGKVADCEICRMQSFAFNVLELCNMLHDGSFSLKTCGASGDR